MSKFFIKLFVFALPLLLALAWFNLYLDPINVVKMEEGPRPMDPDQRFLKLKFLCENPSKYKSFIWGSSRAGKIDVQKSLDTKWYNLSSSQSLLGEWVEDMQYLYSQGIRPDTMIFALDDFTFILDKTQHDNKWIYQPYRDSFLWQAWFYGHIWLAQPVAERLDKLWNTSVKNSVSYDLYHSGVIRVPTHVDKGIEADSVLHNKHKTFKVPRTYDAKAFEIQNDIFTLIDQINTFCTQHKIVALWVFNPIHQKTLLNHDQTKFAELKLNLQKRISYWDFSGLNSVTQNNYFWYETSHPRPIVGNWILNRMFQKADSTLPQDFGVYKIKIE